MRHLDFIVFGVARSGTTALGKALNHHPDVLCSVERFGAKADPAAIVFPDSYLKPASGVAPRRVEGASRLLKRKGRDVALVGDKYPGYYSNLQAWTALRPRVKMIAIYRSPYEYLDSWRRRAEDAGNKTWARERVGLFGLWEMFVLLSQLVRHADDALVVPYPACFFDNPVTMQTVLAHLGADLSRWDQAIFESKMFAQRDRVAAGRPELPPDEMRLLELANVAEIDRALLRNDAFLVRDVRREIEAYLAGVPPGLAEAGEQWLGARRSWRMDRFTSRWASQFHGLEAIPNAAAVPRTFTKAALGQDSGLTRFLNLVARGRDRVWRGGTPA